MPTLWFLKDGRTPYTECGPGSPLSFAEAAVVFGSDDIRAMGPQPPSFNPDETSEAPRNVVLQVDPDEGSSVLLPEAGFYWVVSADPDAAAARLSKERAKP
ncbi:MAG: hypothetical protein AVDCRST_MAG71-42 [uncultured Lysobacter sp.]|uniref:Uncharacterized protein n=1 Tax=uncultured Lysobacter sp. TaxID=271060 RepID=A0A6J4KB77_9GAMM|nr:MAG: hypothetical protein AVDCRST_MAG71-42 [uncultured Lysobacter sp.]